LTLEDAKKIPISNLLLRAHDEFMRQWTRWLEDLFARRVKVTAGAIEEQMDACARMGPAKACEAIHRSIQSGWSGLFWPKGETPNDYRQDLKKGLNEPKITPRL
jgi:hypothetical protein